MPQTRTEPLRRTSAGPTGTSHAARLRAASQPAAIALAAALLLVPLLAAAQELPEADPELDGPVFSVSEWVVQRAEGDEELGSASVAPLEVELGRTATGLAAPGSGRPTVRLRVPSQAGTPEPVHASALGAISTALLERLRARGLAGVVVAPHASDVDPKTGRDLRRPGDTILRLVISTARIRELRTVGFGDRLPDDWRIDHPLHRRIRDHSPLQPRETAEDDTTDLLDRAALEAYLQRLNRHPGRRIDAALAPSEDGQGIALDYRVSESRPWFAYAQASNTGTDETFQWQTRLGLVHRQLSDRDDILSLDWLNAGLDEVNGLSFGYDAPWLDSKRPSWLTPRDDESPWTSWFPRELLPWPRSEKLRFGVSGGWVRILSAGVPAFSGPDAVGSDTFESQEWNLAATLTHQTWQRGPLFLDLYGGFQVRSVFTENALSSNGQTYLLLPQFGARLERVKDYSLFSADVAIEGNARRISDEDIQLLGRINPDPRWAMLTFDAEASHFLEPLLFRQRWKDPSTPGSSKLAHELGLSVRGQYAFDYRLIPQASQVVGGLYSVRGYPQSTAVGDTVVIGGAEYRFHLARSLPIQRRPLRVPVLGDVRLAPQEIYGRADWDLIFRAFVDAGRTIRNDQPDGSDERNQTLLGAGVGLELQLFGNIRARADYARALRASPSEKVRKGNDEFYFLFSILY